MPLVSHEACPNTSISKPFEDLMAKKLKLCETLCRSLPRLLQASPFAEMLSKYSISFSMATQCNCENNQVILLLYYKTFYYYVWF